MAIFLIFAGLCACTFDISGIPIEDAAMHAPKDASAHESDAGSLDGSTGVLHADCHAALRRDEPEPHGIASDLHGRPLFDSYRDVGCPAEGSYETCVAGDNNVCLDGFPARVCLSIPPRPGVCWAATSAQKQVPISFDRGRCVARVSFTSQAAACCHGLTGFDCRGAWPYPHDGKSGQLCARHADCEPGLACRRSTNDDFGLCVCPELQEVEETSCQ